MVVSLNIDYVRMIYLKYSSKQEKNSSTCNEREVHAYILATKQLYRRGTITSHHTLWVENQVIKCIQQSICIN